MKRLFTIGETESSEAIKQFRQVCRELNMTDDAVEKIFSNVWVEGDHEVLELIKALRKGYSQLEKTTVANEQRT